MLKSMTLSSFHEDAGISELTEIRKKNKAEFRNHLTVYITKISSELDHERIADLFEQFEWDLVQDSIFYIDALNQLLYAIIKFKNQQLKLYLPAIKLIGKIGDIKTRYILTSATQEFADNPIVKKHIKPILQELKTKIEHFEHQLEDIKLYDVESIFVDWID